MPTPSPQPWTLKSFASRNGQIIYFGTRIAALKLRTRGSTTIGKSLERGSDKGADPGQSPAGLEPGWSSMRPAGKAESSLQRGRGVPSRESRRCFAPWHFSHSPFTHHRDRDDIGIVIRGSMNLHNATARIVNSKTLHLSNHNLTYYLKSDSEKDMSEFVHKLQELGVSITDQ